jgi:hypothetical protein
VALETGWLAHPLALAATPAATKLFNNFRLLIFGIKFSQKALPNEEIASAGAFPIIHSGSVGRRFTAISICRSHSGVATPDRRTPF